MRDAPSQDELITVGSIAREAGVALHVAQYHMAAHGPPPCGRAGVLRLWRREQLAKVFAALAERRGEVNHGR